MKPPFQSRLADFGFSTSAERIFRFLEPDFGVEGEPDQFIVQFDDVLEDRGRDRIANLLHWRDGELVHNPRVLFGPLDEREYDEALVADFERFYGTSVLYGPDPPSIPIELARGCPYGCYFCTEPVVKGKRVRQRDLDAVFSDVEFLHSQGLSLFWLICSELNIGGAALALEVAERFVVFNERAGSRKARWLAYHLPRWLSRSDLELLYRSGFLGATNGFLSLDDENLRAAMIPYRSQHVLEHTRATTELRPVDHPWMSNFTTFLGNAYATPRTIARTLRRFHELGLWGHFDSGTVVPATRVFDRGSTLHAPGSDTLWTFRRDGTRSAEPDLMRPSYSFAPALTAVLAPEVFVDLCSYIATTLLSELYCDELDWCRFLAASAPLEWLSAQLHRTGPRPIGTVGVDPGKAAQVEAALARLYDGDLSLELEKLFSEAMLSRDVRRYVGYVLARRIADPERVAWMALLDDLGIEHDAKGHVTARPWHLLVTLLTRFDSEGALMDYARKRFGIGSAAGEDAMSHWLLKRLVFEKGLRIRADYRPFLLEETGASNGQCKQQSREANS